jgi:hypothetical protein
VEQANNFKNRNEGNTETKPIAQLLVTPLGKDEPPARKIGRNEAPEPSVEIRESPQIKNKKNIFERKEEGFNL